MMVAFNRPGNTASIDGASMASTEHTSGIWEPCSTGSSNICVKRQPRFTITPQDVYGQAAVGLGCAEAAPIVKAAAIYAVNGNPSLNLPWNSNPRRFDFFRLSDASFPVESGMLNYRIGGQLEMQPGSRMRSISGSASTAWSTFHTYSRSDRDFDGTTPFGTFALDLGTYATNAAYPLAQATAFVVVFEVETRAAIGPLSGVAACLPVQP